MRIRHSDELGELETTERGYVDPEILKEWRTEFRRENRRELRDYLKRFPDAAPEEKDALRNWVRAGNSPYDNGDFIAEESGCPMDFINALRLMKDMYREYLSDPDGFQRRMDPIPDASPVDGSDGVDLPF